MDSRIRVVARIRPKNRKEVGERTTVTRLEDYCTLRVAGSTDEDLEEVRTSIFRFDSVYNEEDDQVTLYEEECAEIVDHCLSGQPGTIIAYGQTGSGKTFSILGSTGQDGGLHSDSGVFLRVFCDLFRVGIKNVQLSAVELYLDDVYDLLDGRTKKKLRDAGTEVVISDMKETAVSSLEDVLRVFDVANSARSVSATSMNEQSSRSHAVFFITIPARPNIPNSTPTRLMLVDLAGSERIKKSQAVGGAVAEAAAINASLSTLGTVVHAMYAGSGHIPYRDSKLTGVLKATFANKNCRVLLVGQFSPAASNSLESISTAKFCDRVKGLAANGPLDGAGGVGGSNGEESKAVLSTLAKYSEISTEMRIARTTMNLKRLQLKPVKGQLGKGELEHFLADPVKVEKFKTEIQKEIEEKEEEESREAVRQCDKMKQKIFQNYIARRHQLEKENNQLQEKFSGIKNTLSQTKAQLEAETEDKMKEAKRAKKKRVVAEEKLAELRAKCDILTKELAQTPENYTLPPSLVDFDADDDPELELQEKKAEASHAIIADFYRYWQSVSRQHAQAIKNDEHEQNLIRERAELRSGGLSLWIQQFASDVVAFSWRRAADIAEGAIEPNEPWAWPDVTGSSRILVDASNWVPNPIHLLPEFPKQPVDDENLIRKTQLDHDEDGGMFGSSITSTKKSSASNSNTASGNSSINPTPNTTSLLNSNNNSTVKPTTTTTPAPVTAAPSLLADLPKIPGMSKLNNNNNHSSSNNNNSNIGGAAASSSSISSSSAAASTTNKQSLSVNDQNQKENSNKESSAQDDDKKDKEKEKKRRKKTPEEIALAEKHYLMGIYDSKNLVNDLIKFLQSGTKVMKHGRAGDPHPRHAWIKDHNVYWVDADPKTENKAKHSIPLSGVGSIILGPHSKVFKRNPIDPTNPSYFLCFTIHLKDGSRTLDFVTENLVDFEAWVIGLVNLAQVDAVWGKNLCCERLEPTEYSQLTSFEKALCDKDNLLPSTFQKVHAKVIEIRNDVAMHMRAFRGNSEQAFHTMGRDGIHMPQMNEGGAILMTKGELRYHCSAFNVDIFRVCKLFEYFRDMGIIFDPAYSPINRFGITSKS